MTRPNIYAHRGASGYAPENTMAAFKRAIELGADGIELDVQMSKDKKLVVCHDEKVDRTTNGKGYIKNIYLKNLKLLDAGYKFSGDFIGERIPTLEEVIELIKNNKMILNIELKNNVIEYEGIEDVVIQMIKKYNVEDRTILSSFNFESIKRVKLIDPSIKTGILYMKRLKDPIKIAKKLEVDAIHPSYKRINKSLMFKAKINRIKVNTFTVNNREYMEKLSKFKVNGIITDYPDIALNLF
ncbi:glycerophosphodiester phosphodiesterase [Clostridium sp. D2Q-14]|uniref:glycerophosphodiester phosphodiesterase n=1 Tax=Anaeromonas gelatinilytica TaxID=2683194 RepID=UPI00193BEB44|nr:glycerophosphodiester phosphodiesterase [Anaeromonas gelatinilytica]MBS4534920.1 glycerophosphodiester phosphodiesterase [Anaeromonas gelatinilytica]